VRSDGRDPLSLALRVLSAWNDRREPESTDIQLLRQHGPPGAAEMPPDALACYVIETRLKREPKAD
jgi:hypothetical protein